MAYKILIVDDSVLTRAAIKRIINMIDVDVETVYEAGNGAEALEVLDVHEVDLVLADLNMPKMNGLELVHKMKSEQCYATIPVVVVSTESSTTRIEGLLEEGIKGYLHKPFQPEQFRSIIAESLGV
jgi:two-component system chemotaxis response regulator CheY